jgi:hypothetical protein
MRPLSSPVDAISPAFGRTRTILTPPGLVPGERTPFRFWFFVKIALVAALTQGNVYGFFVGIAAEAVAVCVGLAGYGFHRADSSIPVAGGSPVALMAAIVIGAGLALILGLFLMWLWCRLRFTVFDLVVYRRGLVGQAWVPYRSPAWRFLGLSILLGLALLLIFAVTGGPLFLHFIVTLRHLGPDQLSNNPALVMSHIFPMYGIILLLALLGGLVSAIAQDFILPPLAVENASLESSFARFFQLVRDRFWHFVLYLLFRLGLELGLAWAGTLVILIVLLVLGGGGALLGFIFYHAFWHAGAGGVAVFVLYCILAALLLIAVYLLLLIALYGIIAVVKQSYAAYFYGSHYPPLGDLLDPSAPIPAAGAPFPPPPFPPLQDPAATP